MWSSLYLYCRYALRPKPEGKLSEALLSVYVETAEQQMIKGRKINTGSLGNGGVVTSGGSHNWGPSGHGSWLIPGALSMVSVGHGGKIKCTQSNDTSAILRSTRNKPVICVVRWPNGNLHYVVAAGKKNGKQIILDPFYGVQSIQIDKNNGRLGNYLAKKKNGAEKAHGTWYPWVCVAQ